MAAAGTLGVLESVFGWLYFFAWSATFWPQVLLNFRRRTTAGLSSDFCAINIVGFNSYAIFTFSSYAVPAVAASYKAHTGFSPQVDLTDVLFAGHGAVMCAIIVAQLFFLPPRIPPNKYVSIACLIAQGLVLIGLLYSFAGRIDWYKFLSFAGGVKVLSSLVKHFPQVFLNRRRGSTVGWSFTMVCLDVVGGGFSLAQQVVKSIAMRSPAPFTSNLAKTFLAGESILFDFWFILQHTVFYPDHTDKDRVDKSGLPARRKDVDDDVDIDADVESGDRPLLVQ